MKGSYKLLRAWGIDIRLHLTFIFLLPLLVLSFGSNIGGGLDAYVYSLAIYLMLFSSVLVHELMHSFVAISRGSSVGQIILTPIGGIASVGPITDPKKEFVVSIAGPLSNFIIGAAVLLSLVLLFGAGPVASALAGDIYLPSVFNFLVLTGYLNLILGAFNLFLPIFPMDGGRVLRAMLNMVTDRVKATRIAVYISQFFVVLLIIFAVAGGNLALAAIGVFIWTIGLGELRLTEMGAAVRGDITKLARTGFACVSPGMDAKELLQVRTGQNAYPVLDERGRPLGIVRKEALEGKSGRVGDLMETSVPSISAGESNEDIVTKVFTAGLAFVVDGSGRLHGIVTSNDLKAAIEGGKRPLKDKKKSVKEKVKQSVKKRVMVKRVKVT